MKDSYEFADLEALAQSLPTEINGYVYESKIGSGGFSRIFKCHSIKFNMDFCAKVIPISTKQHDGCETDYMMLSHLDHPNIVRVFDTFEVSKMRHIILELCPHGSVAELTKSIPSQPELVIAYMRQVLSALAYCHSQHIVHRDIKPTNILVDKRGRLKLIDFGISMVVEPGTMIEDCSGSRPYSAPELIIDKKHDPYKADVWSLGVTFYCMAVGRLPWPDESEKLMDTAIEQAKFSFPKETRREICKVIRSMLQVNPNDRPRLDTIMKSSLLAQGCSCTEVPVADLYKEDTTEPVFPRESPCTVPVESCDYYCDSADLLRGGGVRRRKCMPSRSTMQEFLGAARK